jgi:adenosylcobyric acid synthase
MDSIDHLAHGGRTRELAAAAGLPEAGLLDFSANINPAGPPPWLEEAIAEGARRIGVYPDPDAFEAREAASLRYGVSGDRFLFADGADSLIFALPRALGSASCVVPSPTYSGYLRAAIRAHADLVRVTLDGSEGFSLSAGPFAARLGRALEASPSPALVYLGAPNNPAGGAMPREGLLEIAARFPDAVFAIDESFAELSGEDGGMIACGAPNLIVLRSLTKTWAVPGARVGFASASPALLEALRAELPAWPLSSFGQAIAVRAMRDRDFASSSAAFVAGAEASFAAGLGSLGNIKVHRSGANFLLLEFPLPSKGEGAARALLSSGISVRRFANTEGLDGRFMRIAVRPPEENRRFIQALSAFLGGPLGRAGGSP